MALAFIRQPYDNFPALSNLTRNGGRGVTGRNWSSGGDNGSPSEHEDTVQLGLSRATNQSWFRRIEIACVYSEESETKRNQSRSVNITVR